MNEFALFYQNIRWQDVVDILINSYLLFRFYVIFRGTIVLRGLIGIIFLWFFQRMAVYLGLILASWVIQGITAVAALIIIVVFRNEIRSVIQTKNLNNVLWGISQKPDAQTPVDIVVESVFEMSQKYIGALIVIPGDHDLSEILQNGTVWQGKLSREMLLSIFFKDNPVHDGAAILRGDRITDVGVILPLSRRQDIPSYYGTRHRAALGLSENSDALVVVVSEESGRVITAKNNKITPVHRKGVLADILNEHLNIAPKEHHKYPSRERLEIGIAALVSLFFVMGVWFSFSKGLYTLVTFDVPIEYMNRKPNLEIFDTSSNSVELHLSGSGALIKSVEPTQLSVRIDLGKARAGENVFTITEKSISLPPGISLRKIVPPTVEVVADVSVAKEVPVQADWTGTLATDLIMTKATVSPATVRLVGPKIAMDNLSTFYTQPVDLNRIVKSGFVPVPLSFDGKSFITLAPQAKGSVTVEYVVEKRSP